MTGTSCIGLSGDPTGRLSQRARMALTWGPAVLVFAAVSTGAFAQCTAPPCGEGCAYEGEPCCSEPVYWAVDLQPIVEEESRCFGTVPMGDIRVWPLQMDLKPMFGPPELPRRALDPVAGSLPLVSKVGKHFGSPVPHLETPTQSGTVVLVFGRTLLQAVDFQLPFGGATFRHVWTFGTNGGVHEWALGEGVASGTGTA